MANTTTYEVNTSIVFVRNKPNIFSQIIGILSKGTKVEVINASNGWSNFIYNGKNAYLSSSSLSLVQEVEPPVLKGNITIQYINIDTKESLKTSDVNSNLNLGKYTYTAPAISNYSLVGDNAVTVELTQNDLDKTIVFQYKKILGSVTVKYIDKNMKEQINQPSLFKNLELGSYSYSALAIPCYNISGESTSSVILTESVYDKEIVFEYSKVLGEVTIQYIDVNSKEKIANSDLFSNLELKDYSYNAKSIGGYTLVSDSTKSITLSCTSPVQTASFEYKLADIVPDEKVNFDENPYIATRYVTHTFDINDDVILNFYVTDWNQSDVVNEVKDISFNIEVRLNGISKIYKKYIGENSINLGNLSIGEYEFILQATDEFGRKSHELYNEFRVIDKVKYNDDIVKNTHIITDAELLTYNISKNNDVANAHNTKVGIQNLINDLAKSGVQKAILPLGTYRILPEYKWSPGNEVQYVKDPIIIPSNFTLDLNGSLIKQATTPYEQQKALLFSFDFSYDSHIINGIIEGDYGDRDLKALPNGNPSGEGLACGSIAGESKYCSFDNLTIKKFCGYAMFTGLSSSGSHAITQNIPTWLQGDIDSTGNLDSSIQGKYTSDFIDLTKFKDVNLIRTGQYLGYLFNPNGDSWIVKYSFYDFSKKLISTVIGHQYRDIKKANNASYLRCTYIASSASVLSQVMLMHYYFPRNCDFKNITFEDTRTCALAPFQGNNILIDKCTFARCATNITPVAIDFEDGWHNMQDYCMQNCEILQAVGTGDLVIVGGLDLIFRNNINFRVSSSGCARGQCFLNNKLPYTNLGLTTHIKSAFTIFKENTILGTLTNGLGTLTNVNLVIDKCLFDKVAIQNYNDKIVIRDCIFNWNNRVPQYDSPVVGGNFLRCIFNDFNAGNIHIKDLELTNCTIKNMNMYLQGKFILNNCIVNKCSLKNYTIDINIDLSNNCQINDFIFDRTSWANCNIIFKSVGSTFNNSVTKNIIGDSFSTFTNAKTFNVITNNNIYLNNTILATSKVLNNLTIKFTTIS